MSHVKNIVLRIVFSGAVPGLVLAIGFSQVLQTNRAVLDGLPATRKLRTEMSVLPTIRELLCGGSNRNAKQSHFSG
jgi:hypothetical protein